MDKVLCKSGEMVTSRTKEREEKMRNDRASDCRFIPIVGWQRGELDLGGCISSSAQGVSQDAKEDWSDGPLTSFGNHQGSKSVLGECVQGD